MAVILQKLTDLYHFLNDEISDPRTNDWFLMSNPFPGLLIIGLYLYGVFKMGPKLMSDRPAFSLKHTLIVYNVVQIIASFYITYQSMKLAWLNRYKIICEPVIVNDDPVSLEIAWKVCYYYFIVKMVDLLDTVFFVMRKKQKQVTFLHVYHHAGMVVLSWSLVKWLPGGHGILLITMNSFVHTVMYGYYLLAAYDDSYKRSLWWKKHVTQLQIIQFGLLLFHFVSVFLVNDCQYPKVPSMILIPQNMFLVTLFTDFYIKAYHSKKKQ